MICSHSINRAKLNVKRTHYRDSVLNRLGRHHSRPEIDKDKCFHTFVATCISSILNQSTLQQWRYVDSDLNPADEALRVMTVDELLSSNHRIHSPHSLSDHYQRF